MALRRNGAKKLPKNPARNRARNGGARARATRVLAQGAAAPPRRAFGPSRQMQIPRGLAPSCWNAMASSHAGLPRAVGPYSVVRTTTMFTSKSPLLMFGSYGTNLTNKASSSDYLSSFSAGMVSGPPQWTNVCCVGAAAGISVADFRSAELGSDTHTELHTIPLPGSSGNEVRPFVSGSAWSYQFENANTTAVPSAISVQIICPESVQTAAGSAVAAVCPVRLDLCGSEKSWGTVGTELLSYFRPRVMTGGKLALRGIQMDSLPLSMADVSEFKELFYVDPNLTAPSTLKWSDRAGQLQNIPDVSGQPVFTDANKTFPLPLHPMGWAPLVYYSPYNADRVESERMEMTFLVTVEWRVRFDISNPAVSSHVTHPITSDQQWHHHIKSAQDALPGVIDIVEKVANAGIGVYKGLQLAGAL